MKVLVDTSVWVDFFNGHPSSEADALARLIEEEADVLTCGVVVAEVLQGIRRSKSLTMIESQFKDMQWLTPVEPGTYVESADLYRKLRSRGVTIRSTIDCLIAKLASDNDVLLLSKDRDLSLIIDSGILALRPLPVS
jgi:predicted nucleic acid-binding protein